MRVGGVVRDGARVVRREPLTFAVLVLASALPGLLGALSLHDSDRRVTTMISSLLNLYVQLFATFRTLDLLGALPADHDRARPTEGRYPTAFLASLLSSLAILLGLVVLVLPGLALLVLWGVWMPALAAERLGAVAALRRSWRLTRPHVVAVGLVALVSLGFYLAAGLLAYGPALWLGGSSLRAGDVAMEPLLATAVVASAVLWAAAYRALTLQESIT